MDRQSKPLNLQIGFKPETRTKNHILNNYTALPVDNIYWPQSELYIILVKGFMPSNQKDDNGGTPINIAADVYVESSRKVGRLVASILVD